MALPVTDIATLQKYIEGVMDRAEHHGRDVRDVVLTLVGAIIWKKDPDPIKVMTHKGETKNVLWVRISGKRYALSYNHEDASIEIREGSTQGDALHSFDNTTSAEQVRQVIDAL